MNMTLSPQMRIVALVGLLAIIGFGASTVLLGHKSNDTTDSTPVTTAAATTHAATTAATTTPVHHATPTKHATKPVTKPVTKHHVVAKTQHHVKAKPHSNKFHGNPVYSNLPGALQWQLAHHKVVVVSIYNSRSDTDAISVAEAHQGALDAKVGFLLVNVLDNKVAGLLTALLPGGGLLPDPGVLVYRAPGDIALRLDGFHDRSTVAQAALNVVNGESGPVTTTTVVTVDPNAVIPVPAPADTSTDGTGG